ncbi:MAG: thiamine pyrophosphate-binding protein, partial [Thermoanaerobaculia bacterium]|nr:thiamine pyrophosphate-binding protein [Thermoanaerobaculia bacterium]
MNGGLLVARTLERHGVRFLFTLCGGHISPILVESKRLGLEVVDVRHEATAVFAADAVARLSGVPGVAAVTAGPGATNTITAVKNAQLAQSPLVLLGGATATVLDGRGSLQDIDQLALFRPHVKWLASARRVRDLVPALEEAFRVAASGVPGPVFLECPVDLLYDESVVREWYRTGSDGGSWRRRLQRLYLDLHLRRLFAGADGAGDAAEPPPPAAVREARRRQVARAAALLERAERPVLLVGSQATLEAARVERTAAAVERLGLPTYLSGMARGLLGRRHELHRRHQRRKALKESDLVILAGVPCDFRLDYGRQFGRTTRLVGANRSRRDLRLNRRPDLGILADPGRFLVALAEAVPPNGERWSEWHRVLRSRDEAREREIDSGAAEEGDGVNPLRLFRELDR